MVLSFDSNDLMCLLLLTTSCSSLSLSLSSLLSSVGRRAIAPEFHRPFIDGAAALGPERTSPSAFAGHDDDGDECLMAVAEHIPSLVTSVGGDEFVHAVTTFGEFEHGGGNRGEAKAVEGLVKVGERSRG